MSWVESRSFPVSKMFSGKVPPYKIDLVYLRPEILRNLKIKVKIPKYQNLFNH